MCVQEGAAHSLNSHESICSQTRGGMYRTAVDCRNNQTRAEKRRVEYLLYLLDVCTYIRLLLVPMSYMLIHSFIHAHAHAHVHRLCAGVIG